MDENYYESYEKNLKGLVNMSRISIPVSFTGVFKRIKPLQIVMYKQGSAEVVSQASEYVTGLYIITGVVKTIQANITNVNVTLNREALNIVESEGI